MSEDSLEGRLHQLIGRQHALNEMASVVTQAAENGEGALDTVVDWLNDQAEAVRDEIELLRLEARR